MPELCFLLAEMENLDYVIFAYIKSRVGEEDIVFCQPNVLPIVDDAKNIYMGFEVTEEDCMEMLNSYLQTSNGKMEEPMEVAKKILLKMRGDPEEIFVYSAYFNLEGSAQANWMKNQTSKPK